MKKVLLSVAALSFMTAGYAQLLTYGFEAGETLPGIIVAENWNNENHGSVFPNSTYNWESTEAPHAGERALNVHVDPTDCGEDGTSECGSWQRVIALTNTGFGENKSYRVSFYAKGSGKINVALLKGCFDHDKAGYDQTITATISSGEYTKQSFIFWAPSREYFIAQKSDFESDEYWNQDFLRLSFLASGDYCLDDITIEESAVKAVTYNATNVCVEYAYATNLATLAGESVAELEGVEATVNGKAVKSVEAHADGKLYFFLADEDQLKKGDEVKVSVTNAGPVAFKVGGAYEFTEEILPAVTFTDEVAVHDQNLSETAFADAEPILLSTTPSDGSFEIDPTTKQFTFTFDHMIDPTYEDMKAYLNQEELVVKTEASAKSIVFERTSTDDLVKGIYTLKIQGVATDLEYGNGLWGDSTVVTASFEVGDVQVAQTVYTDLFTTLLTGAQNAVPDNWTCYVKGDANSPWTGGEVWGGGSNCRNLNVTDVNGKEYTAFYLCDRDGYTYLQYGDSVNYITIPAGDIEFSVIALSHDDAGHSLEYRLEDFEGAEIATASAPCTVIANTQFTTIEAADYVSVTFNNPAEKKAILKVHAQGGGYVAVRVLGFRARSYTMTEGDVATSEVVLHEDFSSFGGNMPQEGSGYFCYNANTRLTPGSGRSGTSGILNLGTGGMPAAFFARECGANEDGAHRITYGEEESGQELVFTAGAWDITYKSATWNDDAGNANGTSKTYMELRDFTTGEVVYRNVHVNSTAANYKNGVNANPNVAADKVKSTFNTAGGKYVLWIYGSHNTVVGDILIEKPGSKAVKYHTQLNKYLEEARAELTNSESEEYNGTTKSALAAAVEKYGKVPNGMHTPDEYDAACDELESLTKALATRRVTILSFKNDVEKLGEALANIVGTKYENLEIVPELQQFYNTYKDVNPSTLEDDELISSQKKIAEGSTMISSIISVVNDLYTKQISNLLTSIAANAQYIPEDDIDIASWQTAGEEAISDDQDVAAELQKINTALLYKKIAAGYNFATVDEETEQNLADSIDITGYIANNMMYTTAIANRSFADVATASAAFPGWNITEGTVSNIWWWEQPLGISNSTPAKDASIRNTGANAFKVNQVLNNLPAGTYTMLMKTADCSNIKDVSKTYEKKDSTLTWCNSVVYAVAGADSAKIEANYGEGQVWRNAASTILNSIPSKLEEGAYTITMTIGADMNCTSDAAQVDDTYLYMTGTLAGFDYAAAADAILGSVSGIKEVADREDAPVSVVYYNLNGMQMEAAQGVNIVVERYADGYTVVKKIVK